MSETVKKLSNTLAQFMNDEQNNVAQKTLLLGGALRPIFDEVLPRAYAYAMIQIALHEARGELDAPLLNLDADITWAPLKDAKLRLGDLLPLLADLPPGDMMITLDDVTFSAAYRAIGEKVLGRAVPDDRVDLAYQATGYLSNLVAGQLSTEWKEKIPASMEYILTAMSVFVTEYLAASAPGFLTHLDNQADFYSAFVREALMCTVETPTISLPGAYNQAALRVLFPTIPKIQRHFNQYHQCVEMIRVQMPDHPVDYRTVDLAFYHYLLAEPAF